MVKRSSFLALFFIFCSFDLLAVNEQNAEVEMTECLKDINRLEEQPTSCCIRLFGRLKNLFSACQEKAPVSGLILAKSAMDIYLIATAIDHALATNELRDTLATSHCVHDKVCSYDLRELTTIAKTYVHYEVIALVSAISLVADIVTFEKYLHSAHSGAFWAALLSNLQNYGAILAAITSYRNLCYGQEHFIAHMEPAITAALSTSIKQNIIPMVSSATVAAMGTCILFLQCKKCLKKECMCPCS